jgi:AcrR family transcriptional regulator
VTEGDSVRRYFSPLREENARRTRQAIIAAAHELFTERGYGATSLAEIAAAAGVARPTPSAVFGSKPALLKEILDQALAGDDEPVPVAQRPWFRPVLEASTPAGVLDAYTAVITLISRRAARIYEVVRRAADAGGETAGLWEALQTNRRAGAQMVIDRVAALGPLADGLDIERAADILSVFNDPALPHYLVRRCGWPEASVASWLSRQLRHALLPSGMPPDPAPASDRPLLPRPGEHQKDDQIRT